MRISLFTKSILLLALSIVLIIFTLVSQWSPFHKIINTSEDKKSGATRTLTDRLIQDLETRVSAHPKNTALYLQLADVYLQKVRETADVSFYAKVEELMSKAEQIDPHNPEVFAVQALVAAGRHDFKSSLTLGQKALALNPHKAAYYGIVGDAQVELGQYEKATESFQKMIDVRPDLSSYNRVAYLREIYGDIEGAKEILTLAISSGSTFPENIAWSYVELGKLYMRSDLDEAGHFFDLALIHYKDYPPALEGLGKVAFAKKDYKKSLSYFKKAFTILPIAQYATDLGDLYTKMEEKTKAEQQYVLARIAFEKSSTSGVNTDLEMAFFLADHDRELDKALEKAQSAYNLRPSIYCADALAWAFYKNGEYDQAESYIHEALRLGEYDPLILFHAGMIARENKNIEEAKRLLNKTISLHPYFSLLYADIASETIKKL